MPQIKLANLLVQNKIHGYDFEDTDTILNLKRKIAEDDGLEPEQILYQVVPIDDDCMVKDLVEQVPDDLYILFSHYANFQTNEETYLFWKSESGQRRWLQLIPGRNDNIRIRGKFAIMRDR